MSWAVLWRSAGLGRGDVMGFFREDATGLSRGVFTIAAKYQIKTPKFQIPRAEVITRLYSRERESPRDKPVASKHPNGDC